MVNIFFVINLEKAAAIYLQSCLGASVLNQIVFKTPSPKIRISFGSFKVLPLDCKHTAKCKLEAVKVGDDAIGSGIVDRTVVNWGVIHIMKYEGNVLVIIRILIFHRKEPYVLDRTAIEGAIVMLVRKIYFPIGRIGEIIVHTFEKFLLIVFSVPIRNNKNTIGNAHK